MHDDNVYELVQDLRRIKIGEKKDVLENSNLKMQVFKILEPIFEGSDEIAESVILAYYISSNPRNITENFINSHLTDKLIYASNSLVAYIEYTANEDNEDEFYQVIDYYFSVYKTWKSKDVFIKIDSNYEKLEENIKIQRMSEKSKNTDSDTLELKGLYLVDELFNINPKIATNKLLSNYSFVSANTSIKDRIWQNISEISTENVGYRDHFFLILVAELRIELIRKLKLSKDRKELYYKIDVEEIIQCIRNNSLRLSYVINTILLLSKKVNNLNIDTKTNIEDKIKQFNTWDDDFNRFMIRCFHMLYDITKQAE